MNSRWIAPLLAAGMAIPAFAQTHPLELVLRLQGRISMESLARSVSDPASPRYRKFYTPEELRALAGPGEQAYARTLSALAADGLRVVSQDKTHLFITVTGDQARIEQLFHTKIEVTKSDSARHRSVLPPVIPRELSSVRSVIGLDNTRSSHPMHRAPRDPNGSPTGYEPMSIQEIYGFNPIYKQGITGKGQHIAIATYFMYHEEDPKIYWAYMDVDPAPTLDTVYFNGKPYIDDDSCSETELDSEFSGMIAPGAQIHVFPSAHNDDSGEVELFNAILDDNRAKVVNYSWGDCEANVSAQHFADMNQVFARAVAQGVNILVAAGDWGSYGCPDESARGAPGKVNADWPAANPFVVAVGGTSIDGSFGHFEDAWESTGGGVSSVFPRPSWQSGFQAPFLMRSFPDVAFNADPNTGEPALVHYGNQLSWLQFGGTSIAAPQWSGFLALVGQAREGLAPLGYLNPVIYSMSDAARAAAFNDTTSGSNGDYKAGPGWDATTGWGSLKAQALLDYLRTH